MLMVALIVFNRYQSLSWTRFYHQSNVNVAYLYHCTFCFLMLYIDALSYKVIFPLMFVF